MDKPGDATLSKEASNVERFGLKDGSSCLTREWEYAIDDGEHEEGIKCFAAPIKDFSGETVGAISITGLKREFEDSEESDRLLNTVVKGAKDISLALGHIGGRLLMG